MVPSFVTSQQASSDERLLDFSQGGRVQVHDTDDVLKDRTRDLEPFLPRTAIRVALNAIKEGALRNVIEDVHCMNQSLSSMQDEK